ncbi:MAG TPA: hypothetical protein ENG74_03340 [Thermoplasmatales archaeon]|nr:hypothetical protein [Thermoplasmatales archaeon]
MRSFAPLATFLLLFTIIGCTIDLTPASCSIISYEINDNEGRLVVDVTLNITGLIQIELKSPDGNILDTRSLYTGFYSIALNLTEYHQNPAPGMYSIVAKDDGGEILAEKVFSVDSPSIEVLELDPTWWRVGEDVFSLIEISVKLRNSGSIPVYIDSINLNLNGMNSSKNSSEAKLFNDTLLPGTISTIGANVYIPSVSEGNISAHIEVLDFSGGIISSGDFQVAPYSDTSVDKYSKSWRFEGKRYTITIPLPEGLYRYCHAMERPIIEDYSFYAIEPKVSNYIDFLADRLLAVYKGKDIIDFVAAFVQNINYQSEEGEYPKFPIELLYDGYGDCEDKAILASAILYHIGYDVALIRFEDHMAVGVHLDDISYADKTYYVDDEGKRYIFLETSNKGWELGEAATEYRNANNYTIYHVESKPILIQDCEPPLIYDTGIERYITVSTTVKNIGTADAYGVAVEVVLLPDDGDELSVGKSFDFTVKAQSLKSINFRVDVPSISFKNFSVRVIYRNRTCAKSDFYKP